MRYTAIVIAAGLSSRMGDFKPLLEVGGKPALFRLLDTIRAAGIERICVVTGYGRESIRAAVAGYQAAGEQGAGICGEDQAAKDAGIDMVHNADFESGMYSSVKAGVRWAAGKTAFGGAPANDAALLFPVDAPLVAAETIRGLLDAWARAAANTPTDPKPCPFAVPVFEGKNGHPLLIPAAYYAEILAHDGAGGLKAVRVRYDADMIRYETHDAGCILDMDTPADYAALLAFWKNERQS